MSARTSALLGVIMYAPIVAIAVSFGFTGYALLNDVPGISQGSDWSMSPYDWLTNFDLHPFFWYDVFH